jgi:iron-sulfur cluster assembly protein
LNYQLKFVPGPGPSDFLVESQGLKVLVDSRSALYLKGTLVDFSDSLMAGGFKFSNPNSKSSCSCGESFSV